MSELATPASRHGLEQALLDPPPIEPNAATKSRVLQFDGLRALAFGCVFIHHTIHAPMLWAGVDVFFVLSGFLITGILLERKRLGGPYFSYFYRRRVFRIVPPYLIAVLLFGFLVTWHEYKPVWLFVLAPNVQALRPGISSVLPLWSLAVEEQFYLVWPFVVLFTSEKTLLRISLAALVITPLLRAVCTPMFPNHFYIYLLTPFRADLLCAGAALALLWKRRTVLIADRITRWSRPTCLLGFGLFLGTQAFQVFRLAQNTALGNGCDYTFSLIGATGLLAWTLTDTGWWRSLLTLRPLRYLGEISYTMYLVHILIFIQLRDRYGEHLWVKLATAAVVILYASISWFALERPLIRFAARWPKGVAAPGHATPALR